MLHGRKLKIVTCRTKSKRQLYRPIAGEGTAQPCRPPAMHSHIHPHDHPWYSSWYSFFVFSSSYSSWHVFPYSFSSLTHHLLCLQSKQLEDSLTCVHHLHDHPFAISNALHDYLYTFFNSLHDYLFAICATYDIIYDDKLIDNSIFLIGSKQICVRWQIDDGDLSSYC